MQAKTPVAEPARLIDVEQYAAICGCSARHIYRCVDAGRMPPPVKLGGAVRWDREVIARWIDAGCPPVERNGRAR